MATGEYTAPTSHNEPVFVQPSSYLRPQTRSRHSGQPDSISESLEKEQDEGLV